MATNRKFQRAHGREFATTQQVQDAVDKVIEFRQPFTEDEVNTLSGALPDIEIQLRQNDYAFNVANRWWMPVVRGCFIVEGQREN